jgi:hypothetical protein
LESKNLAIKQYLLLVTIFVGLLLGFSCTRDVTLKINDKNPPIFTFDRNYSEVDRLLLFVVQEIAPENADVPYLKQAYEKNEPIWRIKPIQSENGAFANLGSITYGSVPPGFEQELPTGHAPQALEEGKLYEAGGPYVMMNLGRVRFTVRNGSVHEVSVPGVR